MKLLTGHHSWRSQLTSEETGNPAAYERRLELVQSLVRWILLLSILIGFAWIQIEVQYSMTGLAETIVLSLTVCVEIGLLLLLDHFF